MTIPKVSIVIPVYNVEQYIEQCLISVINQTLKDIEIIIVNDCSPANEYAIIKKYMKKDSRIKYIEHSCNLGLGAARNTGFKHATGQYFGCIDSDDYIEKEMFEKLYNTAIKTGADVTLCNIYYHEKDGIFQYPLLTTNQRGKICFTLEQLPQFINFPMSACLRIYKKDFHKKHILYPEAVKYEDVLPCMTGMIMATKIAILDEPLYHYRVYRPGNITTAKPITKDILKFVNDLHELFKNCHVHSKYYNSLIEFTVNSYYWYNNPVSELYDGYRDILNKETNKYGIPRLSNDVANNRLNIFLHYSFTEKQQKRKIFKILKSIFPIKIFRKKYKLFNE